MKLKDLAKKGEIVEISDKDGNVIKVKLVPMSQFDVDNRNAHYDSICNDALTFARSSCLDVNKDIEKMSDELCVDSLISSETMYLDENMDLLDIENENVLPGEEGQKIKDHEKKNIKERIVKQTRELPIKEVRQRLLLIGLRGKYLSKFMEEIRYPTLCSVLEDPDTGKKLLSMDPKSEDYIKLLSPEIILELEKKAVKYMDTASQSDIRKIAEDPNFLSLRQLAESTA